MLSRDYLRDSTDAYRQALKNRRATVDLDRFIEVDAERRRVIVEVEQLKNQKNVASQEIATLKKSKQDATSQIDAMKQLGERIKELDVRQAEIEQELHDLEMIFPNAPHASVPVGPDESANTGRAGLGHAPRVRLRAEEPLGQIGEGLGILDFERAAKITGARFTVLMGAAARLGALYLVKHQASSLNIRSAFLHIIGDAISSVAVIIGGIVIYYSGWFLIDPILSILIALGIIFGAYGLVAESVNILLESAPSHINVSSVAAEIASVNGVREAYHVHVWTITSGVYALSAHLVVDDMPVSGSRQMLKEIQHRLAEQYKILHSTIQFECERCVDSGVCPLPEDVKNSR